MQPGAIHVLCGIRTVEQEVQNVGAGALVLHPDDIGPLRDDATPLGDPV